MFLLKELVFIPVEEFNNAGFETCNLFTLISLHNQTKRHCGVLQKMFLNRTSLDLYSWSFLLEHKVHVRPCELVTCFPFMPYRLTTVSFSA